MKVDILAIGAHPDDVELGCSGTVLKHISQGKKVGILDLTRGELGTRGDAETRKKEAETAANILGVEFRENLGFADGFFANDKQHQLKLIEKIREHQPEIVLANAISDRHPDHGRAAQLIEEACFYSGLRKVETDIDGIKQDKWRPKAVYHYVQDRHITPDFLVDISNFYDGKMAAIKAFESQFYKADSKEPSSPISSLDFFEFLTARMREYGRMIHVTYAEGFTAASGLKIESLFDLE